MNQCRVVVEARSSADCMGISKFLFGSRHDENFGCAKMEDNGGGDPLDEWCAFVSSPKPSFVAESFVPNPMSEASDGVKNDGDDSLMIAEENGGFRRHDDVVASGSFVGKKGGSIAERRAAKFGFNASRINTARFRTTTPLASPAACSPCLTIPSGISPAALLDSPIMLPNSQLSPTTGNFPSSPYNHGSSMMNPASSDTDGDRFSIAGSYFRFMAHGSPLSLPCFSGSENQVSSPCNRAQSLGDDVDYQTLAPGQLPFDFEFPSGLVKEAPKTYAADSHTDVNVSCSRKVNPNCIASQTSQSNDQLRQKNEPVTGEGAGMHHLLEGDQKGNYPSMGMVRTSEDGYNWRKYGQKQVKGSEYPRSYYKCTHPNCQMKKKVERSHDGQITEIIYKGGHNHPKPQPTRRSVLGSVFSCNEMPEMGENSGSCVKIEGGSLWRNFQLGSKDIKVGSDWRADGLERTLSTSVVTELSDPLSTDQGKSMCAFESSETPELSSTLAIHDDNEDGATQRSLSLGDDADDDESDSKRRKKEDCLIETSMSSRAIREPRVVVQIESEVDILDDGYRWRKYGQKVVKGNPNPRSYYKCTSAGCSVRKHVERASHNLKCVITTYEGKHNHEVPAARNSSHMNSNAGNLPPAAPTQSTLTLPRTTNMPKTERQDEDHAPHFERKPEFNNQFIRPPFLGNFHNDSSKFGASSIYQMKFPPLQSSMPYCYGLNPNHIGIHQASSNVPGLPGLPISLPLSVPRSGNSALADVDFISHGKYISPAQPFLAGQQPHENDMRFIRPKQEQKDDNPFDARLPTADHDSAPSYSSSSIYRQMMGSFPS